MRSNTHLRYVEIESHHDPLDAREEEGRSHFIFPEIKYSLVAVNFTWLLFLALPSSSVSPHESCTKRERKPRFYGIFCSFSTKAIFSFLVTLPSFFGPSKMASII